MSVICENENNINMPSMGVKLCVHIYIVGLYMYTYILYVHTVKAPPPWPFVYHFALSAPY